ncbi:MAG: sulfotransferase [Flavobacteriales bacterium]|nr:sulfotransferase [Flavobacteriales bacterium]
MLQKLNNPNTIVIIGRAHGGTRILPEAMKNTGVYFGEPLNIASDLLPLKPIAAACKIFGKQVVYKGNYEWDFTNTTTTKIPDEFLQLMTEYLSVLIKSNASKVGWKIPNSTLIYPWLVRLLPKASFIHWVRHPEGSTSVMTGVDRLEKWNVPCRKFLFHDWNYKVRAASWKYHYDIVNDTPRPDNFLQIRFEDYISNQNSTKLLVEEFVGVSLKTLELNRSKVWKPKKDWQKKYPFLRKAMDELDYR